MCIEIVTCIEIVKMCKGQKSIRKKVENVPLFAWFVKPWNQNPVHPNSKSGN